MSGTAAAAGIEVVRHPSARRLKLSVDPVDGRVRLTLPRRAALAPALAWAEQQRAWIDAQRARVSEARPLSPGTTIPFGDGELTLHLDERASRTVRRVGETLMCGGPVELFSARITRWLRAEALRVMTAETVEFAAKAGVIVDKVAVGDPKSRWGSCTSTGVIRYSWRLILAPAAVRRATVAHEVAHRVHMNHGPAFHALVAEIYGADPSPARRWLRANGAALHRIGRNS